MTQKDYNLRIRVNKGMLSNGRDSTWKERIEDKSNREALKMTNIELTEPK